MKSILRMSKLLGDVSNDFKTFHFAILDQFESDEDAGIEQETLDTAWMPRTSSQWESKFGERKTIAGKSGLHLWVLEFGKLTQSFFYLHNSAHEWRVTKRLRTNRASKKYKTISNNGNVRWLGVGCLISEYEEETWICSKTLLHRGSQNLGTGGSDHVTW